MVPGHKLLALVSVFILAGGVAFSAIKPASVQAARDGDMTYFRVELPLPDDCHRIDQLHVNMRVRTALRLPALIGGPVHANPCYVLCSQNNPWAPLSVTNVFYGKTSSQGALRLKLVYPKKKRGYGAQDVEIVLEGAEPLRPQVMRNDRNTSGSELSPKQQYAFAQAEWLRIQRMAVADDAGFLNYARTQTLRMAGVPLDIDADFERFRRDEVPRQFMYETLTGARAIQESLQVDRMLRSSNTSETRSVDIASIEGVPTKSHPFTEMMKGMEPKFSDIAKLVPADQYMLRFTSVAKLQELADFGQRWGHSLLQSPEVGGGDAGLRERMQRQICLPATLLSRLLGPAIVKELAVTGSDIFFREGTDITVIFETVSPDLFKAAVDQYWKAAVKDNPGADTKDVEMAGVACQKIVTPDRAVSAYRAVQGNTVIYSNSPVALKRVLETKQKAEGSLASAEDFRYMRAVWPQNPGTEDGFLYLSDAFIRRLTGPATKIAEKRRMEAYGSMRMVLNAAMLHGMLNGPGKVPSLEEMARTGVLKMGDIAPPDGDVKWDAEKVLVSNTVYGTPGFMTPVCELELGRATPSEEREYGQFRDRYQQYWRRYFDPIGVRIKVDRTISFDAYILPLIDESHYRELKRLAGEKPGRFDLSRVSTGTLVRWQVTLDPEAREVRDVRQMVGGMFGKDRAFTDWIGEWAALWVEDAALSADLLADMTGHWNDMMEESDEGARPRGSIASVFDVPIAVGVQVKNKMSLAAFLVGLQGLINTSAPNMVRFMPQEPYKGVTFVKVGPAPGGQIDRELRREAGTTVPEIGLYYGNIGDGWYVTTRKPVLEGLVDAQDAGTSAAREIEYNALVSASPENAVQVRPVAQRLAAAYTRSQERQKLAQAWLLYRCGLVGSDAGLAAAADRWFGGNILLPSGGTIGYDAAHDQTVSSVFGPSRDLKRVSEIAEPAPMYGLIDSLRHMRAWLSFTEHGLLSHVELERK